MNKFIGGTPDELAMFRDSVPDPIRLLLSGHIHQFEAVEMEGAQFAPQLIVGMSGTFLDEPAANTVVSPGGRLTAAGGIDLGVEGMVDVAGEFGFAVLDQTEGGYNAASLLAGWRAARALRAADRRRAPHHLHAVGPDQA